MILRFVFSFLFLALYQSAQASIPGLTAHYSFSLSVAQDRVIKSGALKKANNSCKANLASIAKDGRIDILMAFGYMDISSGTDFVNSKKNDYQLGQVLDRDAIAGFSRFLTSPCFVSSGSRSEICGFKKSGLIFKKTVKNKQTGKKLKIVIELTAPSISSWNENNQNNKQEKKSRRTQKKFLSALQSKDVVVYMGHARSGGGPDFFPPEIRGGKVNYSYYKSEQPGLRAMLSALKGTHKKPGLIGVLACKSTGLFANSIRRYSPSSALVTADQLFDYNEILPTGYSVLEAVVSQKCGNSLKEVIRAPLRRPNELSFFL